MIEGIDAEQHGAGEGPVLVKGQQRPQSRRIEPIEQQRRRGTIAGEGLGRRQCGIAARQRQRGFERPPGHQRRALRKAICQQLAVVRRRHGMTGGAHRDKLGGSDHRTLVEQLEHRVLGIGAGAAPGDGGGGAGDRRAIAGDALAIRFHFELLEERRQQPQPLVIGEHRARRGAAIMRRPDIEQRRQHRSVARQRCGFEMRVHRGGASQQRFPSGPATAQRQRDADRRPQGIAPANGFGEGQHGAGAPGRRLVRRGGDGDGLAARIVDTGCRQPVHRGGGVGHGFGGGEGFRNDDDAGARRVALRQHPRHRLAIDIGDDVTARAVAIAAQRIEQQCRAERRAADADMDDVGHILAAHRRHHVAQQRLAMRCGRHIGGGTAAALSDMGGGTMLAGVDDGAAEQALAPAGQIGRQRGIEQQRLHLGGHRQLGKIHMDAGDIDRQSRQPIGFGVEQPGDIRLGSTRRLTQTKVGVGVGIGVGHGGDFGAGM